MQYGCNIKIIDTSDNTTEQSNVSIYKQKQKN